MAGIYRLINPPAQNVIKIPVKLMSRILKRPMFRKGGEVMEGIMTGIKPRQNYSLGQRVEDYKNVLRAATARSPSTGPDATYKIFT